MQKEALVLFFKLNFYEIVMTRISHVWSFSDPHFVILLVSVFMRACVLVKHLYYVILLT